MRVGDAIHRCHVWQAVFRRSRSHCAPEGARESGQPRWPPPLGGAGAGGGSRVAWGAVGAGRRPGVRCTTSALVCTYCTRGVQENGAIGLVELQTAEILGLIIICFAIHFLCVTIE